MKTNRNVTYQILSIGKLFTCDFEMSNVVHGSLMGRCLQSKDTYRSRMYIYRQ